MLSSHLTLKRLERSTPESLNPFLQIGVKNWLNEKFRQFSAKPTSICTVKSTTQSSWRSCQLQFRTIINDFFSAFSTKWYTTIIEQVLNALKVIFTEPLRVFLAHLFNFLLITKLSFSFHMSKRKSIKFLEKNCVIFSFDNWYKFNKAFYVFP